MRKKENFLNSRFFNGAAVLLGLVACGWTVLNLLSVLLAGGSYQAALQAWGVNFLAGGLAILAASLAGKSLKLRFVRWCGVGGLLAVPFFGVIVIVRAIMDAYYWQAAFLAWFSVLLWFFVLLTTGFHVRKVLEQEEQATAAA